MEILIKNSDGLEIDVKVLQACLARCAAYACTDVSAIEIQIAERMSMKAPAHKNPGMLVYRMKVIGLGHGNCVYVDAVSAKPHLSVEFH